MGKSGKKRAGKAPLVAEPVLQGATSVADVPAAGKKPGAKKAAVKKAAVKKAAVKKAGVKKSDVKKAGVKKAGVKKAGPKKTGAKKVAPVPVAKALTKKVGAKKVGAKKVGAKKAGAKKALANLATVLRAPPPLAVGASAAVLDRLWSVVDERRHADPTISHSARLLSRGTGKVAQKFGEEAVECLIEATSGTRQGLIAESADVLYHLVVMWVDAGVRAEEVWHELQRREGVSGIAEKASRAKALPLELGLGTTKIP